MSIYVNYYSFNEERADAQWKNFPEQLKKAIAGERIESGPREPLMNLGFEKEQPQNMYIVDWDTDWEVLPNAAEQKLLQRAEQHYTDYRDILSGN